MTVVGPRERNRQVKMQRYLDVALSIVVEEGIEALTMQRIANDTDSAIGAIYRYFPSKGALIAAIQTESIDRLAVSLSSVVARADVEWADADPQERSLAGLLLMGRFLLSAATEFPAEIHLFQMLMGSMDSVMTVEEGLSVMPSAMTLLGEADRRLRAAESLGAVSTSVAPIQRVLVWVAAFGGVYRLGTLERYDRALFDGPGLSLALQDWLMIGWGADPVVLEAANRLVDRLEATGTLSPRPPIELE